MQNRTCESVASLLFSCPFLVLVGGFFVCFVWTLLRILTGHDDEIPLNWMFYSLIFPAILSFFVLILVIVIYCICFILASIFNLAKSFFVKRHKKSKEEKTKGKKENERTYKLGRNYADIDEINGGK